MEIRLGKPSEESFERWIAQEVVRALRYSFVTYERAVQILQERYAPAPVPAGVIEALQAERRRLRAERRLFWQVQIPFALLAGLLFAAVTLFFPRFSPMWVNDLFFAVAGALTVGLCTYLPRWITRTILHRRWALPEARGEGA